MSVYNIILRDLTIYVGSSLLITSVLGNLINACVFYKNNLQNPSTFLLFLASWSNIIFLFGGLLIRILNIGFNTDITILSISGCKIRWFLAQVSTFISLSCMCYATIDQFFITSQKERWRRLSKISVTRRVILMVVLFWMLYAIPVIIFSGTVQVSNVKFICVITTNTIFDKFSSYFTLPVLNAIAPITVLIIFGILTYRNMSLIRNAQNRGRIQRHLTSMILLNVIFIVIGNIPFAFYNTYSAITSSFVKSPDRQALESFLGSIVSIISYVTYGCSFYVYYFSSKTHRHQVKKLFLVCGRPGQVEPVSNHNHTLTIRPRIDIKNSSKQ